ncbi:MAG: DUF1634 domain-containing protein [Syntrophobacteraceae bacterium]
MNHKKTAISDARIDEIIGNLLRAGVIVSSLIVLIGGGLYLTRHGTEAPDYHIFHGEPSDLRSVLGIMKDVSTFSSRGMIQFGLLVLIATPVMRVFFTVVSFTIQRDRVYVGVTLIVLAVLLFSLSGAGR